MKIIEKKFFLIPIFFIISFLIFPLINIKEAKAESTIKIVPSQIENLVEPGETIKKEIRVTNDSDNQITMYAYIMDFKAADETGKAELIVPNTEKGNYISSWLRITNEALVFSPGEEKSIPFNIEVPGEVGPGGYYGAIIFGTEPPKVKAEGEEKGAAVSISQQAASLILLQVAGDAIEKAIIKEFHADKQFYSVPFQINFTTKIGNLGNVHIKPIGLIEVKNMLGKNVAIITVNEKGGNILPDSSRIFENLWKDNFGFGRYEASLAMSFGTPANKGGEGKKTLVMKTYFWVLPMKIITTVIIGLLFVSILFIFFLKFYKKRAIRKAMEQLRMRRGQTGYINRGSYYSSTKNFILIYGVLLLAALVVLAIIYFIFF